MLATGSPSSTIEDGRACTALQVAEIFGRFSARGCADYQDDRPIGLRVEQLDSGTRSDDDERSLRGLDHFSWFAEYQGQRPLQCDEQFSCTGSQ
jgi:hypothetical protein